jgi:3-methyladenine DNA glycosylase AlkD
VDQLVSSIRSALREAADPTLAPGMQAYMKSAMPYLGVRVPEVRKTARALAKAHPLTDLDSLEDAVLELWDNATHREERYAAASLTGLKIAKGRRSLIPLHEHMAVTGAWWDHVDEIAHRIADLHDAHPVEMAHDVRRWSTSEDMWLRRLSIISQLGRRDRLDPVLLTEVIEPNMSDTEFFIRKAIGWALREYAKVEPDWVRTFVAARDDELSGLSKREALKHVG